MDIVSSTFPFYAHYYHPVRTADTVNLFDTTNLEAYRAISSFNTERFESLTTRNILRSIGNDVLIPLEGKLVLPTSSGASNVPLVLIGHGNADSYFISKRSNTPAPEVVSFQGYSATQNELARNGIASFSINLNSVNVLQTHDDYYRRIQIFFLHLLLLKFLTGESVTIPSTAQFPIKFLVGGTFTNLDDALTMADSPGSDAGLQELQTLKSALNGMINFGNLGFMGHSRGAAAVARIFEYFFNGATAGTASAEFSVTPELNSRIQELVGYCGSPVRDHVKCILALQPDGIQCKIESTDTLFAVIGGTHDEDVGSRSISIYESVSTPKVMFLVHGATHKRFNSVWRSPVGGVTSIRNMIAADPDIRVLSNRKHDAVARIVFSSLFIATQNNSQTHYAYFARDTRFPVRVDIQRAWLYGFPYQALPAAWKKFDDDMKNTDILNETSSGAPDTELVFDNFSRLKSNVNEARFGSDHSRYLRFTDQEASAFLYRKSTNSNIAALTVNVDVDMSDYTHLSFRFAKWYKVRKTDRIDPTLTIPGIPRRVDLRNFTVQLFENDNAIGNKINGANVRSLIHRAYPTLKWTNRDGDPGFYWGTSITLQTVEVHKSEFQVSTAADFSRVNKVIVELTPERYRADDSDDVFIFNDFTLTHRDFTVPTIP